MYTHCVWWTVNGVTKSNIDWGFYRDGDRYATMAIAVQNVYRLTLGPTGIKRLSGTKMYRSTIFWTGRPIQIYTGWPKLDRTMQQMCTGQIFCTGRCNFWTFVPVPQNESGAIPGFFPFSFEENNIHSRIVLKSTAKLMNEFVFHTNEQTNLLLSPFSHFIEFRYFK